MLDTRAAVRMAVGHGEETLADLDEAIRDGAFPPSYFHRALNHWRLGQQQRPSRTFARPANGAQAGRSLWARTGRLPRPSAIT